VRGRRAALTVVLVLVSWLIALASLAVMLHFVPVTPGYMPDHME
jgi:hypothetical protein